MNSNDFQKNSLEVTLPVCVYKHLKTRYMSFSFSSLTDYISCLIAKAVYPVSVYNKWKTDQGFFLVDEDILEPKTPLLKQMDLHNNGTPIMHFFPNDITETELTLSKEILQEAYEKATENYLKTEWFISFLVIKDVCDFNTYIWYRWENDPVFKVRSFPVIMGANVYPNREAILQKYNISADTKDLTEKEVYSMLCML